MEDNQKVNEEVYGPTQWRKKPVVVEAMQMRWYMDLQAARDWVTSNDGQMVIGQEVGGPAEGYITTLEGPMLVRVGDWVIRGVAGEFYPCKPEIFAATYEEA